MLTFIYWVFSPNCGRGNAWQKEAVSLRCRTYRFTDTARMFIQKLFCTGFRAHCCSICQPAPHYLGEDCGKQSLVQKWGVEQSPFPCLHLLLLFTLPFLASLWVGAGWRDRILHAFTLSCCFHHDVYTNYISLIGLSDFFSDLQQGCYIYVCVLLFSVVEARVFSEIFYDSF